MPIHANNWNPTTQRLAIIHARNCTIKKTGNKILIDQTPTFDRATDPWGITEGNEIQVGQLTGNLSDAEKKAAVIAWVQEFCFDTIVPKSSLPVDEPNRISDPNSARAFWSGDHGVPNGAGLFLTTRGIRVIDFDETALASDDLGITLERVV